VQQPVIAGIQLKMHDHSIRDVQFIAAFVPTTKSAAVFTFLRKLRFKNPIFRYYCQNLSDCHAQPGNVT